VPRCSLARLSPVQCCSSPAWLGCNCRSLPVVDHKLCAIVCHIPVFASRVQRSNRSSRQGPTFTSTSTSTSACCGGGGLLWCCSLAKGQSSDWRAHSTAGNRDRDSGQPQPQRAALTANSAASAAVQRSAAQCSTAQHRRWGSTKVRYWAASRSQRSAAPRRVYSYSYSHHRGDP
jgi:hypothetical protein